MSAGLTRMRKYVAVDAIIDDGKVRCFGGAVSIRTTVQIDDELMARVRRLVPPRGFSQFVNEALAARADSLERARIEAEMREGYIATREDRRELNQDWEVIDGEGWPT
jgi:Arc/MetJ family transcription regulator